MKEFSANDLICQQIQIQYAAIMRAQKSMYVEGKNEMIKELKKTKSTMVRITRLVKRNGSSSSPGIGRLLS